MQIDTQRWFQLTIVDPDGIADLWHQYPGPLIGIATGAVSAAAALGQGIELSRFVGGLPAHLV